MVCTIGGFDAALRWIGRISEDDRDLRCRRARQAALARRLLDAADPDIVEELAIELLGFVRPGDRVVVLPAEAPEAAPAEPTPPTETPIAAPAFTG